MQSYEIELTENEAAVVGAVSETLRETKLVLTDAEVQKVVSFIKGLRKNTVPKVSGSSQVPETQMKVDDNLVLRIKHLGAAGDAHELARIVTLLYKDINRTLTNIDLNIMELDANEFTISWYREFLRGKRREDYLPVANTLILMSILAPSCECGDVSSPQASGRTNKFFYGCPYWKSGGCGFYKAYPSSVRIPPPVKRESTHIPEDHDFGTS